MKKILYYSVQKSRNPIINHSFKSYREAYEYYALKIANPIIGGAWTISEVYYEDEYVWMECLGRNGVPVHGNPARICPIYNYPKLLEEIKDEI